MASVNKVILVGNVGKDPVVRGEGEKKVANFSLATSFKAGGEEKTEWHNIVVFGKLVGVVESYVKKGASVYIDGSLRYSTYEKDGETKYKTEIAANSLQMLGKKPDAAGEDPF